MERRRLGEWLSPNVETGRKEHDETRALSSFLFLTDIT
jgi:hypothetical protein